MNLADLIAAYRLRADDRAQPYALDDETLARFASEGEREAAIRSRLLYDDTSTAVTAYAIAAGQGVVTLHPSLWRIDAASFIPTAGGRAQPVSVVGVDVLRTVSEGDTAIASYPAMLAHTARGQARLWPAPSGAGTLRLATYRLPLLPLEAEDDEPEIGEEHHDGLVDWMLYRGLEPKDGEEGDPQRAAQALADFTERFGQRDSAGVQRAHRERRRVTTQSI